MSNPSEIFSLWRSQIGDGETRGAVQSMRSFLKGRLNDLHDETILRLGDLSRLERQQRNGTLTSEAARVESRQIDERVLSLIRAIEKKVTTAAEHGVTIPTPFVTAPVQFSHTPDEIGLEKIIGANNLKLIDWLRVGLERSRAVCRITTPFNLGTGFLLPGGLMFTNHHVLPTPELTAKSFVEFNVEEDLHGNLTQPVRYEIDASTHRANQALDYCIVRLVEHAAKPQLTSWGSLDLELIKAPKVGEHVTIIQHPAGGPKQIALTANQVVNIHEHRLQYATDTMPGSSGSPVFNDAWKVVALHHKGGNLVANSSGEKIYANEGILMRDILARLGAV
ncbi:MAG TPA: trypsin-like peptidase domain-containing protein [Kiritimatiellia bacterium]|nr:trypsin-like peptidase domain-containing protein [Kiritimatiellia bacterium]HMP33644.1 trypsin-like peptidase domain-containing protein [Kiritimatiellia bacterium]